MIVFYFTATGNSLAVAKRLGGRLVSIPHIIDRLEPEYADEVIGVVFPIYGFGLPKMVGRFLRETKIVANYSFVIGTYGNKPGACMRNVQRLAGFDYAESLLMIDNYLPGFEIGEQIAKLPEKNTEEHLRQIIADIEGQTSREASTTLMWRATTAVIKGGEKLVMKDTQAQSYSVNEACTQCGICARVCPAGNIRVFDKVEFGDSCEWCLGCVHLCPKNAIHLKRERSAARWRNPDVSLNEIIEANDRRPLPLNPSDPLLDSL
ncbi:MAG: EFR1 family ferrodoxin [Coriobacteriales bacterium]|nr:EFR1 family ferrodoxin [Coriobacteriales bacterium]